MRLDKYLKISRIIKRRSVANDACDDGKIIVNGREQRASYSVKINDIIELHFGNNIKKYRILCIKENPTKEEASKLFEEIN